ncbi:hypothetical protein DSM110277_01638 [Sulfitobacter pontiacus]|uniref:Uncharacterized protein n=1 Tax=Sulfitobacter pontiacus TaxID=60137 RepID=A0AAX3AAX1_9RHOB|nr:hypothetical protein DSM110277_01638 [Sulfitobacter pontiacus]
MQALSAPFLGMYGQNDQRPLTGPLCTSIRYQHTCRSRGLWQTGAVLDLVKIFGLLPQIGRAGVMAKLARGFVSDD